MSPNPMGKDGYSKYTRLEPCNKIHSIEEGVQSRIKDPLWIIGRQWQLGKFLARNSGTPVRAGINFREKEIDKLVFNDVIKQIDHVIPLEAQVENEDSIKCWNNSRLEYDFMIKGINTDTSEIKLEAKEYDGNELDWFSFNIISSGKIESPVQTISLKTSRARYPGMPNSRWWTFEDSRIDVGDIKRPYLNNLTILLMEFALLYSNDWYILPVKHTLGCIRKIEDITIVDSFGIITSAAPVIDTTHERQGWEIFTLTPANDDLSDGSLFFLPNNIYACLESEPVEKVSFLRDEMANLVWGIEYFYENADGEIINRDEDASRIICNYCREGFASKHELQTHIQENHDSDFQLITPPRYWDTLKKLLVERDLIENDMEIGKRYIGPVEIYTPISHIKENWIPYIPRTTASNGQIMLRRARTKIDITNENQYKGVFLNESKYIYEEEVSRSGIMLTRTNQLSRDLNGKINLWKGRKKNPDSRRKSSGLRFDYLERNKSST